MTTTLSRNTVDRRRKTSVIAWGLNMITCVRHVCFSLVFPWFHWLPRLCSQGPASFPGSFACGAVLFVSHNHGRKSGWKFFFFPKINNVPALPGPFCCFVSPVLIWAGLNILEFSSFRTSIERNALVLLHEHCTAHSATSIKAPSTKGPSFRGRKFRDSLPQSWGPVEVRLHAVPSSFL